MGRKYPQHLNAAHHMSAFTLPAIPAWGQRCKGTVPQGPGSQSLPTHFAFWRSLRASPGPGWRGCLYFLVYFPPEATSQGQDGGSTGSPSARPPLPLNGPSACLRHLTAAAVRRGGASPPLPPPRRSAANSRPARAAAANRRRLAGLPGKMAAVAAAAGRARRRRDAR